MEFKEKTYEAEKPKSYRQILEECRERGKVLEDRFRISIEQSTEKCFARFNSSSREEFAENLSKWPTRFSNLIYLSGFKGEVYSFPGGEDRFVYLAEETEEGDDRGKNLTDRQEEGSNDEILGLLSEVVESDQKFIGAVWRSRGVINNRGKLLPFEHNGVIVEKSARGYGLGYAMYRQYEEIFGKMKAELADRLSLLKLYLQLGFKPKKVINQEDGEELPFDIESMVERYFSNKASKLPHWIYLERDDVE